MACSVAGPDGPTALHMGILEGMLTQESPTHNTGVEVWYLR
jgi:hypothetical protein